MVHSGGTSDDTYECFQFLRCKSRLGVSLVHFQCIWNLHLLQQPKHSLGLRETKMMELKRHLEEVN